MKQAISVAIFIFSLLPFQHILSQDITGLWKGSLYNDTTQKYIPYELAISEENGKLSGYSYTVFDIDGKPELGVKKVKIKRKDNEFIIEDEKLIYNTYTAPPPRGVHQASKLALSMEDTLMVLSGVWQTNRTIKYRPLSGTIRVQRNADFKAAELFKKLEELNQTKDLSFAPKEKIVEPVIEKTLDPINTTAVTKEKTDAPVKKSPELTSIASKPSVPAPVIAKNIVQIAAADVAKRKVVNTQEVYFTADSLTLTLYDNGEVDGDVVSVLLNGKMLFEKAALTTKPNRKTIYIDKTGADSLQLVMYAENLGSIPPNTGILVVNDGEAIYEVRFSADLQTNAAILLRRKK